MQISRIVVKNFRLFEYLDVDTTNLLTCIIGENNTGKTALLRAIQLCLDINLPSIYRSLTREDINSDVDIAYATQVLIGVELTNFEGKVNEEALVCTWKTDADKARIFYRFRPRSNVRDDLASNERNDGTLSLDDYSWELRGGGDSSIDLKDIDWDCEIGEAIRFADLQSYLVIDLPALRDVEGDLRNIRRSPLVRLIEAFEIDDDEKEALINILNKANQEIEKSKSIVDIALNIDKSLKNTSGPAFEMDASLGISEATFQAIVRNLRVLLSDEAMKRFEPSRNGLGMNNILYVAILLEYLNIRHSKGNSSGQLVLIEEPEAHLHPQLQISLLVALQAIDVQVILTTHSTQIASQAPLSSYISLTKREDSTISFSNLSADASLTDKEIDDLERFLDVTKSNLLFARKVVLVEGPSEAFLIPAMLKSVHGINLEREGISIIPIYGVHFNVYAKLFQENGLEKKCAIVADADMISSDSDHKKKGKGRTEKLKSLENKFLKIFLCKTTFEREIVNEETLPMFISATDHKRTNQLHKKLKDGFSLIQNDLQENDKKTEKLEELGDLVLKAAKKYGKARFSQVVARHADHCNGVPDYIQKAIDWLRSDEID